MFENRKGYSLILFVPGVNRVESLIQVHLESYDNYEDAKAVCLSYKKAHQLDARVIDYSGNVCYPNERFTENKSRSLG